MAESHGGEDLSGLVRRAARGDQEALARLFELCRGRLRQMVRLRLDRRLTGRVDPSDVLQEAYLDAARQIGQYPGEAAMPFFLALRLRRGRDRRPPPLPGR